MNTPLALFSAAMTKLGLAQGAKIAVAVSGGGDSMALALLMEKWIAENGGEMLVLTVDHGLRPEACEEAKKTAAFFASRGIAHEILTWQSEKPVTHVQERARQARYDLLLNACREKSFDTLALAHNLEDQIETFWMRLAHGSGLEGLAGMAASRMQEGIRLLRPLLQVPRQDLRDLCRAENVPYIDDPSNADQRYLRVKLRGFEGLLGAEGLTPARLSDTLQKLEEARSALRFFADQAAQECLALHDEGYATLMREKWLAYPADIRRRLLSRALSFVAPQDYASGHAALENLGADLPDFSGGTLQGCDIFLKGSQIFIAREMAAIAPAMPAECGAIWDSRFLVANDADVPLTIGALGADYVAALRKGLAQGPALVHFEALPQKVRLTLPAVFHGQNLVAVPHLSWVSADAPAGLRKNNLRLKIV